MIQTARSQIISRRLYESELGMAIMAHHRRNVTQLLKLQGVFFGLAWTWALHAFPALGCLPAREVLRHPMRWWLRYSARQ